MDDLRKRLHEATEAHQPDREAILARVEQGMARSSDADRDRLYRRRRQASRLKVLLAAIAGVSALGLGGLAVAAGVQQRTPQHPSPPATTVSGDGAAATPKPPASATRPATATSPAGQNGSTAPHSAAPTAPVVDGPISAWAAVNAHSIPYWEQNDLTVDVKEPLAALTVELRISQTGGVQNTGDWQTAPTGDFTVSVTQESGFLVYRWVLKPGHTVPAARQIFSAQFNHATGKRDAGRDSFRVQTTVAGHTAEVHGDFPAGG